MAIHLPMHTLIGNRAQREYYDDGPFPQTVANFAFFIFCTVSYQRSLISHRPNTEDISIVVDKTTMPNTTNEISRSDSTPTAATIPPSLIRQCITLHHRNHRCSNEAIEMASEFIRLLIIEARRRAAIEVRELLIDTCFSFWKKPTLLIQSSFAHLIRTSIYLAGRVRSSGQH